MADKEKTIESYNNPNEYGYVGLTFDVGGNKYSCKPDTFRDTALDLVGQEFSNNVVAEYNRMVATRQEEMRTADNTQFPASDVVRKAYLYSMPRSSVGLQLEKFDKSKRHEKVNYQYAYKSDNLNSQASSIYIDIAIASAMNKKEKEIEGAYSAAGNCDGIARLNGEYNKAFKENDNGNIPPEETIKYFDDIYKKNGMGSVRVDLETQEDLKNHLRAEDVRPGARVVCDVAEKKHTYSMIYAVKNKNGGYNFFEAGSSGGEPLNPSDPKQKSAIEQAQRALESGKMKTYTTEPTATQFAADRANFTKVEYDYILKETREYMYTGVDPKTKEPTFSRLATNGGDLNVPLSQLPITKTHAVIDHTKLCVARAEKQLDNSPTLNPGALRDFVPNLAVNYSLPKEIASQFTNDNELQLRTKMVFENIYNEHNPEIKGMLLAQNMKDDQERAFDLADGRVKAAQDARNGDKKAPTKEAEKTPPLVAENDKNNDNNNNDATKGLLAVAQYRSSGRSGL